MISTAHALERAHSLKCALAGDILRSSGQLRLQVNGWSMLPSIWPGDTLLLESVAARDVAKGDIVLFARRDRLFAHRVIKACGERILTRGDALPWADAPVSSQELLGRVAGIVRNQRHLRPGKRLSLFERSVAALVRSSDLAARVVVGMHGLRQITAS